MFIIGCETKSWYYELERSQGGLSVMLKPTGRAKPKFGALCAGITGERVSDDQVPDDVWAAYARWRLTHDENGLSQ